MFLQLNNMKSAWYTQTPQTFNLDNPLRLNYGNCLRGDKLQQTNYFTLSKHEAKVIPQLYIRSLKGSTSTDSDRLSVSHLVDVDPFSDLGLQLR